MILENSGGLSARLPEPGESLRGRMVLRPAPDAASRWLILAPAESRLRLNGERLGTGISLLQERDELLLPGCAPAYFSTEEVAAVAPLPDLARPVVCPRCRQEIATGSPAVCCPGCGVWHHQSPDSGCWNYSPTCAQCVQPTSLAFDHRWRPEEVGL